MQPPRLAVELYRHEQAARVCRRVDDANALDVQRLIEGMKELCLEQKLASLAAPQVGVLLRVIVLRDANGPDSGFEVLVNPEVANLTGRDLLESESCPSLPGATAKVWRSEVVHLRDSRGPESGQVKIYTGQTARLVQHEIDHLNGILYIDRMKLRSFSTLDNYARYHGA